MGTDPARRRGTSLLPLMILLAVFGAAALLLFRAQGPGDGEGVGERLIPEGTITVAYPEEPLSLNPYTFEGDSNATRDLLRPVMPTLLLIDHEMNYRPGLAVRVPTDEDIDLDPFTVTFRLRSDARWSDGAPITSADVRFTWETIRNPAWPIARRYPYDRITDVREVGSSTVELVFDSPYPAWRDVFSAGDFILPKQALEGKDFAAELRDGIPVGAGPYLLEAWEKGLQVVYTPNPNWWGETPAIERVRIVFVPSFETAQNLLERQEVDALVTTSRISTKRRIEQDPGSLSKSSLGSSWWELVPNAASPKLNEIDRRRSVFHAIDRAGIAEAVIRSDGRGLQHLRPGSEQQDVFDRYERDPEVSRQARGSRDLGTLALTTPARNEMALAVQRSIQVGLRDAALPSEITNPEADRFYGDWLRAGTWDLAVVEKRGTPSSMLRRFHSSQAAPNGVNYSRLAAGNVDQAVDASERTRALDPALLDAVMVALADEAAVLPIFEARMYAGFRRGIEGIDPNATIDGPFWNLERWRLGAP